MRKANAESKPVILRVLKARSSANLPRYAHGGDAGLDLCAAEDLTIGPGSSSLVRTGIKVQLPEQTEAQIRPRSGLALKHTVTVLNSPGTVDSGYRGEIGVILINLGRRRFRVRQGMRIAQLVVQPVLRVKVVEVSSLTNSKRATQGFGSSGI